MDFSKLFARLGVGSYDDPVTFATATNGPFNRCDVIYIPYLQKYARFEDYCGECGTSSLSLLPSLPPSLYPFLPSLSLLPPFPIHSPPNTPPGKDWLNTRLVHIDIWTGSATSSGSSAQLTCENTLTRDSKTIIVAPGTDLGVDSTYHTYFPQ